MFRELLEQLIDRVGSGTYRLEEFSNFFPQRTGLDFTVWIDPGRTVRHKRPRCKIQVGGRFVPVSVDEPVEFLAGQPREVSAKQFRKVQEFIRLNREALLQYWRGEIDTGDLTDRLKSLEKS